MDEVFKRENDKMVRLTQHNEKSLTNQEVYNYWVKLCTEEAKFNTEIRKVQGQLDQLRERKEAIREIAKDCEKRIPKDDKPLGEVDIYDKQ